MNKKILTTITGVALVTVMGFGLASTTFAKSENGIGLGNMMGTGNGNSMMATVARELDDSVFANGMFNNRRFDTKINQTQPSVALKATGEFKVTGVKVNSASSSTSMVNITFYGFTRDINVSGATVYDVNGKTIALGDIKAGDILSATGTFNSSTRAITVSKIVDVSIVNSAAADNLQNRINELLKLVEQLKAQLNQIRNR